MNVYRLLAEGVFSIFVVCIFVGGYFAVRARLLMNAVLGLALSLVGVGGLFFYLGSPFVALMQILIYVGAICVILAFGIMVGPKPKSYELSRVTGRRNLVLSAAAAICAFSLLLVTVLGAGWGPELSMSRDFSIPFLGENLLYRFCLAFELISVLLLTAILGALIVAGIGREDDGR